MHPTLTAALFLALSGVSFAQQPSEAEALSGARLECGTALEPRVVARLQAQIMEGRPGLLRGPGPEEHFVVPVTFHVVRRSDGTGGLGAGAVRDSLMVANAHFVPVGIEFCQVGEIRTIADDQLFDCVCGSEQDLIRAQHRVEDTLNVYFAPHLGVGGSDSCGIATLPGVGWPGVLVRNACAGNGDTTIVHELGHFFDLLHTHETRFGRECADGTNCAIAGDLVCDTPADPNLSGRVTASCVYTGPTGGHCPSDTQTLAPLVDNHMSYARESCRSSFTPGQIARMREALVLDRSGLARTACPSFDFEPTPGLVRASTTPAGEEASAASAQPAVAPKGRYVAFVSTASNLLPRGATPNGLPQVFVRDMETGALELVSVAMDGSVALGFSDSPALSADGRYVCFTSSARDLVPGTDVSAGNVFRRDRWTGTTLLVTRSPDGGGANVFERNSCALSWDGRYVAFRSRSTNLVPGTTGSFDRIYVADLGLGAIELASVDSDGQAPSGRSIDPVISADGRFVAFASSSQLDPLDGDTCMDVFLHDRVERKTRLVSIGARGEQAFGSAAEPSLSADGRFVAFTWAAVGNWPGDLTTVLGDVVVKDMLTGELFLASSDSQGRQTAHASDSPALSADGRTVAFRSLASDFYDPPSHVVDHDVWLKDLSSGAIRLVSVGGEGHDTLGAALELALDARAETIVFSSLAANLVAPDGNDVADVFVASKRRPPGSVARSR